MPHATGRPCPMNVSEEPQSAHAVSPREIEDAISMAAPDIKDLISDGHADAATAVIAAKDAEPEGSGL